MKIHSNRVEKIWKYTGNEWRRCKITLETSGDDVKLHSKRVEKIWKYTRNEWRRYGNTLTIKSLQVMLGLRLKI